MTTYCNNMHNIKLEDEKLPCDDNNDSPCCDDDPLNQKPVYIGEDSVPTLLRGPSARDRQDADNFANAILNRLKANDKNAMKILCKDDENSCVTWKEEKDAVLTWQKINKKSDINCTTDKDCKDTQSDSLTYDVNLYCIKEQKDDDEGVCGFVENHVTSGCTEEDCANIFNDDSYKCCDSKFKTTQGRAVISDKETCESLSNYDLVSKMPNSDDFIGSRKYPQYDSSNTVQQPGKCLPKECEWDPDGNNNMKTENGEVITCMQPVCDLPFCIKDSDCPSDMTREEIKCDINNHTCIRDGDPIPCTEDGNECGEWSADVINKSVCSRKGRYNIKYTSLENCNLAEGIEDEKGELTTPEQKCDDTYTTGQCYLAGPCPLPIPPDPDKFTSYLVWKDDAGKCSHVNDDGSGGIDEVEYLDFDGIKKTYSTPKNCRDGSMCITYNSEKYCSCTKDYDCEGNSKCINTGTEDKPIHVCQKKEPGTDTTDTVSDETGKYNTGVGMCVFGNSQLRQWCENPNCRSSVKEKSDINLYNNMAPFVYDPNKDTCHITNEYCKQGGGFTFGKSDPDSSNEVVGMHLSGGVDKSYDKSCDAPENKQHSSAYEEDNGCNDGWFCAKSNKNFADKSGPGKCVGPGAMCEVPSQIIDPGMLGMKSLFHVLGFDNCDNSILYDKESYNSKPNYSKPRKPNTFTSDEIFAGVKVFLKQSLGLPDTIHIQLEFDEDLMYTPTPIIKNYANMLDIVLITFSDFKQTLSLSLESVENHYPEHVVVYKGKKCMKVTRNMAKTNKGFSKLYVFFGSKLF